jgi:hypothetical protein
MTRKQLAEMLKYSSSRELYIVTWDNRLIHLFCPFKVIVLYQIDTLNKDQVVSVEEVKVTLELITVYIINKKAYYYYHFDILFT